MSEVKPVCCGCGGNAVVRSIWQQSKNRFVYQVACEECFIQTIVFPTEAEAVEEWNRAMFTDKRTFERVLVHDAQSLGMDVNEPAKPFKIDENSNRWHCGHCSTAVGRFWVYCQKCGYEIDWSVRDELQKPD